MGISFLTVTFVNFILHHYDILDKPIKKYFSGIYMFSFIKKYCQKLYSRVTEKFVSLFSKKIIDESFFSELEDILLTSDVGISTTKMIMASIRNSVKEKNIIDGQQLKAELIETLEKILANVSYETWKSKQIFILVGINGSGKTTSIAKLAYYFKLQKKRVLCVAADTFRAAAVNQLATWTEKLGIDLVIGKENQDPSAIVFSGCDRFKKGDYDILIIDTAGRLQTKLHLMAELGKMKRVIQKHFSDESICTILTLDSMLGQNSIEQAKLFTQSTQVNGVILTKFDGTGKGGVIFAIAHELHIPTYFITFGEKTSDIKLFNPQEFVTDLVSGS